MAARAHALGAAAAVLLLCVGLRTTKPRRPSRLWHRVRRGGASRRVEPPRRAVLGFSRNPRTAHVKLDNETLARAFNLADEVAHRQPCRLFTTRRRAFAPTDVVGLAIARAASDAVVKATTGTAKLHMHECTLADWAAAGARRVVVSLRDPVSRLVSGFQRRMEGNHVQGGAHAAANRIFEREFPRLDAYVDALFAPADPRHALALEVTYPDNFQNFLVPVEEFYLASLDRGAPRDEREVAVDVRYACIESLDDDVAAILGAWGRAPNAKGLKNATKHQSQNASDAPTTRRSFISDRNAARVEALYAADAALHARHCAADRGREPGGETFRFRPR